MKSKAKDNLESTSRNVAEMVHSQHYIFMYLLKLKSTLTLFSFPQRWSNSHAGLKKRPSHEQDTLNEEYDFKSPNDTDLWNRPRCGVPDYPTLTDTLSRQQRRKRFALYGRRWEKTDLTYNALLISLPNPDKQGGVYQRSASCIKCWYWHGDSLPFDGPGGILAHAYFPQTQREGEVHFDYDEHWTVGNNAGTDLLQVAAHEFGHVLGLQHSLEPDAVMCPFYSDAYPLQLSEDDKRGIQYLYGSPRHTPPVMTETNEIETELVRPLKIHPNACKTNFDAVSMIRGELFFFKSQYIWRIRDGQLQAGYPALSSRHWKGIPEHIDAAFEDKSGNIWFFQGDSYWIFDAERKITGPDSVRRLGLPVTHIEAALKWEEDHTEKVYFFKSSYYWSFNIQDNRINDLHPHSIYEWRGMPSHIDGAFLDRYGYANFLSGMHYWKFDPVALKVLEGYPRSIGMDFFGCSANTFSH
uniref:Matrix metallopeptidase 11b n=1 Tax=Neolamprologus brichardi TaxID=32507 RepID=A0A3Q4MEJ1_NEOBR